MHDRDMISLKIIVDVNFPVTINKPIFPLGESHRRQVAPLQPGSKIFQVLSKRHTVRIDIHKNQRVPDINRELWQAERFLLKTLDPFELRRSRQATIQPVGPSMVPALKS